MHQDIVWRLNYELATRFVCTMREIAPSEFELFPWKNNLGFTKQIAVSEPLSPYWRMSIAEVTEDSEFSVFENLHRVLTVIDGNGMDLLSNDKTIKADFEKPVSFPGDMPIRSQLRAGSIKDFNLIFDPSVLEASVTVVQGVELHKMMPTYVWAIYVLAGEVNYGASKVLAQGSVLMSSSEGIQLGLSSMARILVIKLRAL